MRDTRPRLSNLFNYFHFSTMNVIRFSDLCAQGAVATKRVFIRADLNVPQDDAGNITEDTRIRASVPAIEMALKAGAAVMVTSHLGRPTEGAFKLRGYATVYDVPYPIAGGPEAGGWMETIARGATAKSIKDGADVRLLYDHGGIALARTASSTMRLVSDDMGMMVDADLENVARQQRDLS